MSARGVHNSAITWTPYYRVAWGGTLGDQGEIWTNSMKYVPLDNSIMTVDAAVAAGPPVWAALKTWFNSTSFIGAQASMTWLKLNNVNSAGLQGAATNVYAEAPFAGQYNQGNVPLYQTFAITMRTSLARGRGHIGRIFPPAIHSTTLDANGRLPVTDAGGMATAFATCIQSMQSALRTATGTVGSFSVLSPGNTLKSTVPIYYPIITVEVDTVPDVQHRRTNKLKRAIGTPATIAG